MSARRRLAGALVTALAAAALLLPPVPAAACTCLARDRVALIEASEVVFVGRTVAVRSAQAGAPATFWGTFDVASVYKGSIGRRVVVRTASDPASCGTPFVAGRRYAVFAGRDAGSLVTDVCRGTTQELAVLDGLTPTASANEPAPNPPPGSRLVPIATALLFAAAVATLRQIAVARRPRPIA
jgi:hypothetical protein